MKILIAGGSLAAVLMATISAQQTPSMPQPGAEQKNIQRFAGTWQMEGTMQPSPLGPGGKMTGTETCRMFEGGWHMVCDSSGTSPMGAMKGHSILTHDRAAKQYRFFAINTMPDAEMATGTYMSGTWTWEGKMELAPGKSMRSRFTITESSPTVHLYKWEMSEDGTKWTTVMEGKGTKTSN